MKTRWLAFHFAALAATFSIHAAIARARPNCPVARATGGGDVCDPDPEPPIPPPPPPPYVSAPDAAFQALPCLPAAIEAQVTAAVEPMLPPNSDIRVACIAGSERIGAWFRPTGGADDGAARQRGLSALSLLQSGETFAANVSAMAISRQAYAQWASTPKRLNGDGKADPNGPVHLTNFTPRFTAPNQVLSVVNGYDERPWPDVSFTLTTTDTLAASGGRIQCQSSVDFDADTSLLNVLTGVFSVVFPPLGIVFGIEDIIVSSADAPGSSRTSLGCPAAQFFPASIMIPGGLKVVVQYSRAQVSGIGIVGGGSFSVVPRAPAVSISGPRTFSVEPGNSAVGSYAAIARDLRAPLSYSWTASGSLSMPNSFGTRVTFPSGAHTGLLSVNVTDADGLTAQSSLSVTIRRAPPDDGGGDPPICMKKPWLPQCRTMQTP